jgi:hypothetical protein
MKKLISLVFIFVAIAGTAEESSEPVNTLPVKFNLDKVKMNVVKTAENGIVNNETVFAFSQMSEAISAEYSGGKILRGFLVGKFLSDNQITFSYCQMQSDGTIDNGVSVCEISQSESGKITLTEHFEWKSRPGEFGTNIFQEI